MAETNVEVNHIEQVMVEVEKRGLRWAEIIDSYRIFPRIIVGGYGWLVANVCIWYMGLPEPTANQAAFVSTIVGAAAIIVGFYVNTGRKWTGS